MKNLIILALFVLSAFTTHAQFEQGTTQNQSYNNEVPAFSKKGKILLETGYSIFGFFGGGTSFYLLSNDGESVSSFGVEGGYFVSESFAIKGLVHRINTGGSSSLTTIGLMGKYYIANVAPMEIGIRSVNSGSNSDSSTLLNFGIGYGIELAPNIYLEPSLGILTDTGFDDSLTSLKINFAMFL